MTKAVASVCLFVRSWAGHQIWTLQTYKKSSDVCTNYIGLAILWIALINIEWIYTTENPWPGLVRGTFSGRLFLDNETQLSLCHQHKLVVSFLSLGQGKEEGMRAREVLIRSLSFLLSWLLYFLLDSVYSIYLTYEYPERWTSYFFLL